MLDPALFGEMVGEWVVWFDEDEADEELDMVDPDCDGDDLKPDERPRMSAIENLLAVVELVLCGDDWWDWATACAAADMASANEFGKLYWFENVFNASIAAAAAFAAEFVAVAAFVKSTFDLWFAALFIWLLVWVVRELFFDLFAEQVGDVEGESALFVVEVCERDEGDEEFDDNELFKPTHDGWSIALLFAWPFKANAESIEYIRRI